MSNITHDVMRRWYEQMLQQMLQGQRQQAGESDENKKEDSLSFTRQATTRAH